MFIIKYFKISSPAFSIDLINPLNEINKPVETQTALTVATERAIAIMMEELNNAITAVPEYDTEILKVPLLKAFSNPDMYEIRVLAPPTSFSQRIATKAVSRSFEIKLNLYEVAGSPEDLASAVLAARMMLGYGDELQGERATNAWYQGLYRVAREGREIKTKKDGEIFTDTVAMSRKTKFYRQILRSRLQSLQDTPAYWYLLNYGNANIPRMIDSNKGGEDRKSTRLNSSH